MNISRVVIHTPLVAHSALVWIDTRAKTVTFTDVRSRTDQDSSSPFNGYMDKVDVVTSKLLKEFFSDILTHSADYKYLVDIAYVDEIQSADCQKFGYCNAYVIKQVVDYKSDREFDSRDIAKFASTIERKYKHLLNVNEPAEIEYIVGGLGLGLGLGVLGGAAIAGAASASRPQYVYQQQYPAYGYGYPAYQGYPAYGGYY
ncbi:Hypothetical protein POVR2_LOCUS302 [uncultured virus]|nr:Hypothetical protein POVR2_LOCUS302 [uncultured virus]